MTARHRRGVLAACVLLALAALFLNSCGTFNPAESTPVEVQSFYTPTAVFSPSSSLSPFPSPTSDPTPRITPTPNLIRGAACLPGQWNLTDPAVFFQAALDSSGSPARLIGVTGSLSYNFNPDGHLEITYDDLSVSLNAAVEGGSMLTRSTLDGSASATTLVLTDSELRLSDFGGEGLLLLVEVDGQLLVQSTLPAWVSFFAALSQTSGASDQVGDLPEEVRAGYECAGNRLSLRGEGLAVEMELIRVR